MTYYLILESNGKTKAVKTKAMTWPITRAALERIYPGRRILTPLERPTGPIQVVTVYMSRTREGRSRCSPIEQWGLE